MRKSLMAASLGLMLTGCALIQSHTAPEPHAPDNWRTAQDAMHQTAADALAIRFWRQYGDPVLDALEEQALKASPDVRIAAARVEAFRARVSATSAERFPQIGIGATAGRGKGGTDFGAQSSNLFSLVASLNWELDLWGRLTRATDAARADLLGEQAAQRGVYLTLASAVATTYFGLRQLDAQLAITYSTVKLRRDTLDLFQLRFQGGVISELELSQVESEYASALAAVPQIEASIAQSENALAVLLGNNPGPIERGREIDQFVPPEVPAGLPSELIARRPDIQQAEASLAASDARVDAARLAWFPSISITGLFGYASSDLSDLFKAPFKTWSGVATLAQPIFDAGKIDANIDIERANREIAAAQYQKTVQTAFKEVDDALIGRQKLIEELAAKSRQLAALGRYAELARLRYENGYTSYLEVIDAERSLFSGQLDVVSTRSNLLASTIDLYRSLGGTWMEAYVETEKQAVQSHGDGTFLRPEH